MPTSMTPLRLALAASLLALFSGDALADRRVLLVGINKYEAAGADAGPRTRGQRWTDLDGAVGDAQAMRDLLVRRFAFKEGEIHLLADAEATRARILSEIDDFLVKSTKPGDLRVFYYAGHGSQVRNSKSDEWDKLDETIVPADVAKLDRGDIRDKELGRRWNQILDAKGELVVVMDSCHSGSGARGLPPGKLRAGPADERDVADATPPPKPPESRGALVLSAASDFQTAGEGYDAEQRPHGVFSLALMEVLGRVSLDEPVERVFASVRAVMQRDGRPQEPVLGASDDRKRRPLFGGKAQAGPARPPIAIGRAGMQGDVELRGGVADGLAPGCELVKLDGGKRVEAVRVRVEKVKGMAAATGRLVRGKPTDVREGDLLVVDKWAPADAAGLHVYIPPAAPAAPEVLAFAASLAQVAASPDGKKLAWADDPSAAAVSHTITWDGQRWTLVPPGGAAEPIATPLKADALVARILATWSPRKAKGRTLDEKPIVFAALPPTAGLATALRGAPQIKSGSVEARDSAAGANYRLVGRSAGGKLEYAWVQSTAADPDAAGTMPPRTDFIPLGADAATAERLDDLGRRLGRLRAWLTLASPDSSFPYHLALQRKDGKGAIRGLAGESVVEGETYDLVLVPDADKVKAGFDARYVYVFAIDSDGRGTLLFPPFGRENRVPAAGAPTPTGTPPELVLGAGLEIGPPFGVDTYVLLATGDKLTDPSVLELDPVRTRERQRGAEDPLSELLSAVGTRGPRPLTPPNWSIERMAIRSRARR